MISRLVKQSNGSGSSLDRIGLGANLKNFVPAPFARLLPLAEHGVGEFGKNQRSGFFLALNLLSAALSQDFANVIGEYASSKLGGIPINAYHSRDPHGRQMRAARFPNGPRALLVQIRRQLSGVSINV
jgi:hypothetical protein